MPERLTTLEQKNPHPMDARVRYVDETHTYYLDGVALPASITAIIHSLFPQFDPEGTVKRCFHAWVADKNSKYNALISYLRIVSKLDDDAIRKQICLLWSSSGAVAAGAGTAMHAEIESYENDGVYPAEITKEFDQFLRWRETFAAGWTIHRTEWSVYHEEARVAGQIDALYQTEGGEYIMADWKRCDPTPRRGRVLDLLGPDMECYANETGTGPCCDLPNTKYGHYCVQQNLYAGILRKFYGVNVGRMYLVQLHPKLRDAHVVEVPHMPVMVECILRDRVNSFLSDISIILDDASESDPPDGVGGANEIDGVRKLTPNDSSKGV